MPPGGGGMGGMDF